MRQNDLLVDRLACLRGDKWHLAWQAVAPVLDKNASDITWIETLTGESFSETHPDEGGGAIFSEADFLHYQPDTLMWLAQQLGDDFVTRCRVDMQAEEVATWIGLLHDKLAEEAGLISQG